jgi:hypothetical protein
LNPLKFWQDYTLILRADVLKLRVPFTKICLFFKELNFMIDENEKVEVKKNKKEKTEKRLNVKMDQEMHNLLFLKAKANKKNVSEFIRKLIEEVLIGESKNYKHIEKIEVLIDKNEQLIKSFNKLGVLINQAIKLKILGLDFTNDYKKMVEEVEKMIDENKKLMEK